MRSHIVTVFLSHNYGSYFQALALGSVLENRGSVDYVVVKTQNRLWNTVAFAGKRILKRDIRSGLQAFRKYFTFEKAHSAFQTVQISDVKDKEDDIFVFGSDEIWNISREPFCRCCVFWGEGLPKKYRFSMSVSVNNSDENDFFERPGIGKELAGFIRLSARDVHSKTVLEKVTGKPCALTADPTLLPDREWYQRLMEPIKESRYLLIYSYGAGIKGPVPDALRAYANARGLQIISIYLSGTYGFGFCDKVTSPTPGEFLSYFNQADAIVTDTYHGLLFSLIFKKQFYVLPSAQKKVREMLALLGLTDRICEFESDANQMTETPLDYFAVYNSLEPLVKNTMSYLDEAICACSEKKFRNG